MSSASTGLMAAQTGLRAVSDNIANVNTTGYVRKLVNQQPLISQGLGVGVDVARVVLAGDKFLQSAALNAAATAGSSGAISDMLDRTQAEFGDPSTGSSFFTRLDNIYAAFSAAVDDPNSTVRRGTAISSPPYIPLHRTRPSGARQEGAMAAAGVDFIATSEADAALAQAILTDGSS